jgi:rhodanese-related sulfurtransferase
MPATLTPLKPEIVADRIRFGRVIVVDIREADEFARRHVKGALSRPLSSFESAHLKVEPGKDVVFTCRSGMRTAANCDRLAKAVDGAAFVMEGGVDAWAAEGLPVEEDRKAPMEIMRQVQIAAGSLVLTGVILGYAVNPVFFGLAALIGAGLTFSGATGYCGMARLLSIMPWNRPAGA